MEDLTPRQAKFCQLYVELGSDRAAGHRAVRVAYKLEKKSKEIAKRTLTRRMNTLLKDPAIRQRVAKLTLRHNSMLALAERELGDFELDVAKAKAVAQFEALQLAVVVCRQTRKRVEEGSKITTAEAKCLDTTFRVTGDIGGVSISVKMPDGATEKIEDVDKEIERLWLEMHKDSAPAPDATKVPENAVELAKAAADRGHEVA